MEHRRHAGCGPLIVASSCRVARTVAVILAAVTTMAAASVPAPADTVTVTAASPADARLLPLSIGGRVERGGTAAAPAYARQWPGGYFETAFRGKSAYLRVGPGDVILQISVDDRPVARLTKPQAGFYRIDGLGGGLHRVRAQIVSENQATPSYFLGFYGDAGTVPASLARRARQIEFIGDSHTVGYGNTATTRDCTPDEVNTTTDTARGIAGILATRYRADYRANAISGRGVVRNFDGGAGDTLPVAYPFVLFDKATRAVDPDWHPQAVVVALGTNDFSTPLHAGEPWRDRAALHADFEATYAGFLKELRARYPKAYLIVWATDLADGEIQAEAGKTVARLQAAGERRIAFVPVGKLAMSGCHWHPSVADDKVIADTIGRVLDARSDIWRGQGR